MFPGEEVEHGEKKGFKKVLTTLNSNKQIYQKRRQRFNKAQKERQSLSKEGVEY